MSSVTNDKITEFLPPASVTSSTTVVLVNAIAFEGRWQYEFPPWQTRQEPFHRSPTKYVDMMHTSYDSPSLRYAYLKSVRARVVELPYYRSQVAMYIVLPNWNTGVSDVEKVFTWNPESMKLRYLLMDVSLPKFALRQNVKLAPQLKSMGVNDLFGAADLSGIDGQQDLQVDDVYHQACINVTEAGTEASAATAVNTFLGAKKFTTGFRFAVNRPFLFFLWDRQTKSLLFTGRFLG